MNPGDGKMTKPKNSSMYKIINDRKWEWIYIISLALFSFRKIFYGIDLWDTAYNYCNFENFEKIGIDSMWQFATYIPNLVGHFFTKFPFGDTLLGMNFYTTMVIFFLEILVFLFFVYKLKLDRFIVFVGCILANCLSSCPSAVLYNYITYLLLSIAVIVLYLAMVEEKRPYYLIAGLMLGINIFVRFSNLPELALGCCIILGGIIKDHTEVYKIRHIIGNIFLFSLGYIVAIVLMLTFFSIRYDASSYINAISELMSIESGDPEYSMLGMLNNIIINYVNAIKYMLPVIIGIAILCLVLFFFYRKNNESKIAILFQVVFIIICWCVATVWGLWRTYNYAIIWNPILIFILFSIILSLLDVCDKGNNYNHRVFSCLILVMMLIVPIGSNTIQFTLIYNLYLIIPYIIFRTKQILEREDFVYRNKWSVNIAPIKIAIMVLGTILVFRVLFYGLSFVYTEAYTESGKRFFVSNNKKLCAIRMTKEKADDFTFLSEFISDNNLENTEAIGFGYNPGLLYYLNLVPVINAWPDLESFSIGKFSDGIQKITNNVNSGNGKAPVIIIDKSQLNIYNFQYEKYMLLENMISSLSYSKEFDNERYSIYVRH